MNDFNPKTGSTILRWFFIYSVVAVLYCLLTGCSSEKKISKAVATLKKHDRLDDTCAANFPVIDKVVVRSDTTWDTIYVEPPTIYDTVYKEGEVIVLEDKTICPPAKIITRTIRNDSIIMRRDVAYENVLKDKIDSLTKVNKELDIKYSASQAYVKMLEKRLKGNVQVPWWVFVLAGLLIGAAIKFKAVKILNPFK